MNEHFKEFLKCLDNHGVEYLIVGGYAVIYHGYLRETKDIDFLVASDHKNLDRVLAAVGEFFGIDPKGPELDQFYRDNQFTQLGIVPNRIAILKSIPSVDFKQAFNNKVEDKLFGEVSYFLDMEH